MRLLLIASLLLSSTSAWAAPAPADHDADAAARRSAPAGAKIAAVYDFEQDEVDGEALRPDHEPIRNRVAISRESMIKVRQHFIPQLLQMANDV